MFTRGALHEPARVRRIACALILVAAIGSGIRAGEVAESAEVNILLVGSRARGADHWITVETYLIENLLEFNGIPYEFFDIGANELTPADLEGFVGVILEGYALKWDASQSERELIASRMSAGDMAALLTVVHGKFDDLNGSLYAALEVSVTGVENDELNIALGPGASVVYDCACDEGFVFARDGSGHVGVAVTSLGRCTFVGPSCCSGRVFLIEAALTAWMERAFGVDARVTLPVISLAVYDTQATRYPRSQDVIDFVDANRHRIRATGYLVTDLSAYQGSDAILMSDEEMLSRWGSMSLHGKDHGTVGAEGEDRDFVTQFIDMFEAKCFLQDHFERYRPIKGCPNNSWNEETLHAMALLGIPYHCSTIRRGEEYRDLYKSVIDAGDDFEREKIFARGDLAGFRYYPLRHSDGTGTARVYSVDWYYSFTALDDPEKVPSIMRQYALDWWVPVLPATHFCMPDSQGAPDNPEGWMAVIGALMDFVDHENYPWRRWVDNHAYAASVQRFDRYLEVNSITVSGDVVTYDLTAEQPQRYLTLKAWRNGTQVESVVLDGMEYSYFGEGYVHLPEITGNATVTVTMGPGGGVRPHVYHVDPCAVVEGATITGEVLSLKLSGEFESTVRLAGLAPGEAHLVWVGDAPADTGYSTAEGKMEFVCPVGPGETQVEVARASCTAGVGPRGRGVREAGPPLYLKCGPNPFSARGYIRFGLPVESDVRVSLYSVEGRRIAVLLRSSLEPGHHSVSWDGRGPDGSRLPSGIYFCRLEAGDRVLTRKILIVR